MTDQSFTFSFTLTISALQSICMYPQRGKPWVGAIATYPVCLWISLKLARGSKDPQPTHEKLKKNAGRCRRILEVVAPDHTIRTLDHILHGLPPTPRSDPMVSMVRLKARRLLPASFCQMVWWPRAKTSLCPTTAVGCRDDGLWDDGDRK